jgi:hypothetical protein
MEMNLALGKTNRMKQNSPEAHIIIDVEIADILHMNYLEVLFKTKPKSLL